MFKHDHWPYSCFGTWQRFRRKLKLRQQVNANIHHLKRLNCCHKHQSRVHRQTWQSLLHESQTTFWHSFTRSRWKLQGEIIQALANVDESKDAVEAETGYYSNITFTCDTAFSFRDFREFSQSDWKIPYYFNAIINSIIFPAHVDFQLPRFLAGTFTPQCSPWADVLPFSKNQVILTFSKVSSKKFKTT